MTNRYAVLLHATGLRKLNQEGKPASAGVYTWKLVDAPGPEEAGEIATAQLRNDDEFTEDLWNTEQETIDIAVEEVARASADANDSGFVYYFDDEEEYPYGFESGV